MGKSIVISMIFVAMGSCLGMNPESKSSEQKNPGFIKVMNRKFTKDEDQQIVQLHLQFGNDWHRIAGFVPGHNAKQCERRWRSYLDPRLNESHWTEKEDILLLQSLKEFGFQWRIISDRFPGRSISHVRNRYAALTLQTENIVRLTYLLNQIEDSPLGKNCEDNCKEKDRKFFAD